MHIRSTSWNYRNVIENMIIEILTKNDYRDDY